MALNQVTLDGRMQCHAPPALKPIVSRMWRIGQGVSPWQKDRSIQSLSRMSPDWHRRMLTCLLRPRALPDEAPATSTGLTSRGSFDMSVDVFSRTTIQRTSASQRHARRSRCWGMAEGTPSLSSRRLFELQSDSWSNAAVSNRRFRPDWAGSGEVSLGPSKDEQISILKWAQTQGDVATMHRLAAKMDWMQTRRPSLQASVERRSGSKPA
jgi:hypothetical protein